MRATTVGIVLLLPLSAAQVSPPVSPRREVVEVLHGEAVSDPYRWLEDDQSLETQNWVTAQTHYARSLLDGIQERQAIKERLAALLRTGESGGPVIRHGKYFYPRRSADEQAVSYFVRDGLTGPERRLIDGAALHTDRSSSFMIRAISRRGTLVAYGVRQGGSDKTDIRVLAVGAGGSLDDRIAPGLHDQVIVLGDDSGFLYTVRTPTGTRVLRHDLNTPETADTVVLQETAGTDRWVWLTSSTSGDVVIATVQPGSSPDLPTDLFVMRPKTDASFRPLVQGLKAAASPTFAGEVLLVRTNLDAPNWRVMRIDLQDAEPTRWQEVVRESDSQIQSLGGTATYVVLGRLRNVSSQITVHDLSGRLIRQVQLPTIGWAEVVAAEHDALFYRFTSFTVPPTFYRLDLATGRQSIWFRQQAPGFDPERTETRQVWFRSRDGTKVPMFVIANRDARLDGKGPTVLTGYGGYGQSYLPFYDPQAVLMVERGGVFAVANIRGGGEFGEAWHRAGMLDRKQNSFDDFVGAAEWLIRERYTSPQHLAIRGTSNGGLLVGVAMTQRPELFKAVVSEFPHLDMVRYHKFGQGNAWVQEFGNPEEPEGFAMVRSYSPYHHIKPGTRYPAALVTTGADERVAPLHARKMTALMQAAGTSRPVLLRVDAAMGHAGAGRTPERETEYQADVISFILWQTRIDDRTTPRRTPPKD